MLALRFLSFLQSTGFRNYSQHDAHEFVNGLFDELHVASPAPALASSTAPSASSFISLLYRGELQSTLRCTNQRCQYASPRVEVFTSLSLPLCNATHCNLLECFDLLCVKEQLGVDEVAMCGNCEHKTVTQKTLRVHAWPNVLVVHLKRFKEVRNRGGRGLVRHERLNTAVSFPLSDFCVDASQQVTYDCVGVVNHMGNCEGGHYTAHALRDGEWFFFNDALPPIKIESPEGELNTSNRNAYILFFFRRAHSTVGEVVREVV